MDWLFSTLKQYPEIAIFLTLAIGYYFGKFTFKGIGLGSVTATLLAGVLIGQIGITIAQPLKATVFLMFLFAVGYGVGPQFVRGVARDGVPQALFSVVQCLLSLLVPFAIAKLAGYDLGYAAGLYSGSQTISAAMGLSTDAINRAGMAAEQAKALIDSMPVAYAVTYMFGTMGSAVVIAVLGPKLLGINLEAACKDYEQKQGGVKELGGPGTAWRRWEVRAYRVLPGGAAAGLSVVEAESMVANGNSPRRPVAACKSSRKNRWRRRHACSSCASAATGRSRRPPRTPFWPRATSWRSRAPATCSCRCSDRTRSRSRIGSCWRCRSRASTSWSATRRSTARR